ncbi:MAG: hypothetical protein HGB18_04515 [Candidatus Moranbacteria bacterium]|nr:hypothetical protein [Candidatus Moranbacteria bacterium]
MQEDSFLLSPYRIRLNFGVVTATRVQALTKRKKNEENEEEYLDRVIRGDALTVLGKALDRLHNCRTLLACPPEKRRKQIDETRKLVMPKLLQALRSCGNTFVMYADYIEKEMEKALSIAEASLAA